MAGSVISRCVPVETPVVAMFVIRMLLLPRLALPPLFFRVLGGLDEPDCLF